MYFKKLRFLYKQKWRVLNQFDKSRWEYLRCKRKLFQDVMLLRKIENKQRQNPEKIWVPQAGVGGLL